LSGPPVVGRNPGTLLESAGKGTGIAISKKIRKLKNSDRGIPEVLFRQLLAHVTEQVTKTGASLAQAPLQPPGMRAPTLTDPFQGTVPGTNGPAQLPAQPLYYVQFCRVAKR
jgi:hypothetical protein